MVKVDNGSPTTAQFPLDSQVIVQAFLDDIDGALGRPHHLDSISGSPPLMKESRHLNSSAMLPT